jgi:acylphosphatase
MCKVKEVGMSDAKRLHVIVEGRVQGVFFRAYTRDEAVRLGLSGWVRNRPNGSVEALVEGEKSAVEKMVQWFHQGSPNSVVEKVHLTEESPVGDSGTFEIHYY